MAKVIDDAITSMIANLKERTGKSLDDWLEIAASTGKSKHGEILAVLKKEHGLTHGYANLVARRFLQAENDEPTSGEGLVGALFAGAKGGLRPLYDAVIAVAESFGPDVEVDPKKTYVSLRRKKQFALVVPSTAKRLDLGLNLKGVEPAGRLEASGSFNAMCTHRVRLESKADFDVKVIAWMKRAYETAS
jgi:predicted transport protein